MQCPTNGEDSPTFKVGIFKLKMYRETCAMFERMEIAEQVYEGKSPSKIIIREDANYDSHVRKRKGRESASPTNPKKVRTGNNKTRNAVSLSEKTTGAEKTCLLHGPGHSYEECKVLKFLKSSPHSVPIKIKNPTPEIKQNVVSM